MDKQTGIDNEIAKHLDEVHVGRTEKLCKSWKGLNNEIALDSGEMKITEGETGVLVVNINGLGSRIVSLECDGKVIGEMRNEGIAGNLRNLIDQAMVDRVNVMNSDETRSVTGKNEYLELKIDEEVSSDRIANQEIRGVRENGETSNHVEQERISSGGLGNSVGGVVVETVIVITSEYEEQNGAFEVKNDKLGSSTVSMDEPKMKMEEVEKQTRATEMKCSMSGGGNCKEHWEGERVCRICHLNSEVPLETTGATTTSTNAAKGLIQLGCRCKDELGVAHIHCAEVWFKIKGNRTCEICGETAKNITGVGDNRFRDEWNEEGGFIGSSSETNRGCWRGQPFCNFLMACLVIAFVFPWFFRVNIF